MTPTPRLLDTPAGRLACLDGGGAGQAVLFLHGIGGAAAVWQPQIEALQGNPRWRPVAWDMPGYGGSATIDPLSFPALADSALALLDALGCDQAVWVGHSLGGMIAQEAAASRPERVAALVLSGTSPAFGPPDGEWQQQFVADRLRPLDEGLTMADLAPRMVAGMIGDAPDPAGIARAEAAMAAVTEATYRASVHLLPGFDRRAALPGLTMPTLLIAGEKDGNAPAPMMEKMAGKIPGARYVCLAGAGHLANLERPVAFSTALLDFLSRLPGGSAHG